MNRLTDRLLLMLVTIVVWQGCASSTATTVRRDNLAHLYGRNASQLRLHARVYHATPSQGTLYFKLHTGDLLYKSDGDGGPFRAAVRVSYEAFADWNTRNLLDSASTLVTDQSGNTGEDKELIGSLSLRDHATGRFVVKVTARDMHRDTESVLLIKVDRDPRTSGQYYLPLDSAKGLPLFDDHLAGGQEVRVRCDRFAGQTLQGRYFRGNDDLPAPVFATAPAKRSEPAPDSTFQVTVDDAGTFRIALRTSGTYHVRADSAGGFALFAFDLAYPYVDQEGDLLKPLRYITSLQEYDRLQNAGNMRQAVERFWLDAAGERERARQAIRTYYSRVENANRHFTSDVEGWRTDRGLVHIIFGTPTTIYKSDLNETWIYGEENNLMSLTFTFVKRQRSVTDNDLVLNRDPMLKSAWYRNVESWRNGRVYQN